MFSYPESFQKCKDELYQKIDLLKEQGYHIEVHKEPLSDDLYIDKITVSPKSRVMNRIVLSSGIHGVEGFVGHVCQMYFLDHFLPQLERHTQVVLYHIINPYGMMHNRRFNQNNIDLNRNYSKTNFTLKNPDFIKVQSLLVPKKPRHKIGYNMWFYYTVITNILRHGVSSMNRAILKGQKIDPQSIYYSGKEYEPSTKYILNELDHIYAYVDKVVWIDLHSGYGRRYQMSVINSRYETAITKELKSNITYPDIIGFEQDAMYDTDGDITEKLYEVHKEKTYQSDLLALCYEFGTIGSGLPNELKSFRSILLENNVYHKGAKQNIVTYKDQLIRNLFLPDTEKWKTRQMNNFIEATTQILALKKLM